VIVDGCGAALVVDGLGVASMIGGGPGGPTGTPGTADWPGAGAVSPFWFTRRGSPGRVVPVGAGCAGSGVASTAAGRLINRSGKGSSVSGLSGPPARLIATMPA
jgi:hypothetical protein